ncbi:craniofacial development protein 2-like [Diorhabda sublineata]|uniref:craniofacial development protein 2-like n=1 Tax=Diorhabda sublineata TaxID=1163346 RepID=UPI0024E06242|nr:craniofacial development protein 2-like [Diorhabda sublineata]
MKTYQKQWPPVPSGSNDPGQGSGQTSRRAGGAKNPWVKQGCQLHIATYNARSIGNEERLTELQYELDRINWDILGISETRRRGEESIRLRSGHILFYKGREDNSLGGVGFLVNKRISPNLQILKTISDRVIYITLKINSNITIKVVQIYAPTSSHEDEEIEVLYDEITQSLTENKTRYTLIIGDFNARIGEQCNSSQYVGQFGLGKRNERGTMLANFLEKEQLYIMNTFFKKRPHKKWTWANPDGITKNEIDYVLTPNKHIVQEVDVLNSFNTGSDHRLVRCRIVLNTKLERAKKFNSTQYRIDPDTIRDNKSIYSKRLTERLTKETTSSHESLDETNNRLVKELKETTTSLVSSKTKRIEKFTTQTKQLLERRRELIKDNKRNTVEYAELNKTARKMAKQDIRKYQENRIEELIQQNRGLNIFKKENAHKKEMIKLRDGQGNITEDRREILKVTEKFYTGLYESKIDNEYVRKANSDHKNRICNVGSEDLPEIEEEEIVKSLNQLKNGKAAGDDNIIPEMLKEGGSLLIRELKSLFNTCLTEGRIPQDWNTAIVILIYKKGDPSNLENYRPISLLSQIYKLFMRIIANRLEFKLDAYQPYEQAGFRKGMSTIEHLHTVRTLNEKVTEYNIPLWIAFIDFRKAFDTVEFWAIIRSMKMQE